DIFDRLQRIRDGASADVKSPPKLTGFDAFASGKPRISSNRASSKLYAETLPREIWSNQESGLADADQKRGRRSSPARGLLHLRIHGLRSRAELGGRRRGGRARVLQLPLRHFRHIRAGVAATRSFRVPVNNIWPRKAETRVRLRMPLRILCP